MRIPRGCLGNPQRVRVSAEAFDEGDEVRRDRAPAYHRFGRWTARG